MATEDLRINYSHIARVKQAKLQQTQPAFDDRYYPINVNWDHLGKVLNAKAKEGEGNMSITGIVDEPIQTEKPTLWQRICLEIEYRIRMFRVKHGFGRKKFKRNNDQS